ncbi:aconitate hydratase AcnA [Micavibrio aeruginosavorus]|uniref:Aconitate hydratase n=1 Tax=Micavibrio aeruginosavorus (strain ARL-13) TaxID=856793 RepID=G2KSX3_MICAA|nr:aconitate hydratase AcnA [Micavibrio aeruginosavorus]AEP10118.1 aconitate hydratase 1 [Micavibrio aeruginosavorus ARL-13]
MTRTGHDSLKTRKSLTVDGKSYDYFSLPDAAKQIGDVSRLPFSMKVLLENLLRFEDGVSVTVDDVKACHAWLENKGKTEHEVAYRPARVLMQDFTGVPAVVDLAAMREAMKALGGNAQKINPLTAVDLVIDHSVMVDAFGNGAAFQTNVDREFERNGERYAFLRWGQQAFRNFRVVPPGTGICHQVNLEYLAQTVWVEKDEERGSNVAYPDTLVGTDSHTTMVNGLAVLGWGVGGIEAEAAMLGQPVSMLIPQVIGFKITGKMKEGTTATDLVLTVTEMLRKKGVVNKFVEFYGPGLDNMSLADRATIGNMAPEYGATCGFFPIDRETIRYLTFTGRDPHRAKLVEEYAKAQGMWRDESSPEPVFTDTLELDLGAIEPSIAGPKRPQDRVVLSQAAASFKTYLADSLGVLPHDNGDARMVSEMPESSDAAAKHDTTHAVPVEGTDYSLKHGDVVIAAITSCTNTSNPSVMLAAGLVAKKAHERGMKVKPWVKTSLAPGSQVVTDYLDKAGLTTHLDAMGFNLVGYGCTTCIGNSGPLPDAIAKAVETGDLTVAGVLSGNRNFEGRINPHVKANYLASPPLVVAYALAGNMKINLATEALGNDKDGKPVFLKDIWPTNEEIADAVNRNLTSAMFSSRYKDVFLGPKEWQAVKGGEGETYDWDAKSTYVANPPYFTGMSKTPPGIKDIKGAACMALFGDSITTDHISPAGSIKKDSPAGKYLIEHGVDVRDFNSYGARRGHHEVMMRGTFANIRIKNEMLGGKEGGYTKYLPTGEEMPIYDACMKYIKDGTPLIVVAGKEYGTGSSRDWAAKGTFLLGVKCVLAESFERIHRSNLVGMGVLPLMFKNGQTRQSLKLDGTETFDILGLEKGIKPRMDVTVTITRKDGSKEEIQALCRIDTQDEIGYYENGGIMHYVLRDLAAKSAKEKVA